MTPDAIERHTQLDPGAPAVIDDDRLITRALLRRELACMVAGLQDLGVATGTRVAIACEHGYVHWLVTLACERLGAVADAVLDPQRETWATMHDRADLVLGTFAAPAMRCPFQQIDQYWLDDLMGRLDLPVPPPVPRDPQAPVRVARTSGTTGTGLRMLVSRQCFDRRVQDWVDLISACGTTRYLMALQPSASTACYQAAACMQAGALLVLPPVRQAWRAVQRHAITDAGCLPGMLAQWLAELPPDFAKPAGLRLLTFGAAISPALRQMALSRMAWSLVDVYAGNECGVIATGPGAGDAATLRPGVSAHVVDDAGHPVAPGAVGRIRVRTQGMASAYLDAPQATAANFSDGWFYTGDLGQMPQAGTLRVTGRESDAMNLGGLKVAPEDIESRLQGPGVAPQELAVCALPGAGGLDEVWVALCGDAARHQHLVLERLKPVCADYPWAVFNVVQVPAVNPQAPAKLSRRLLRQQLRELIAARSPGRDA